MEGYVDLWLSIGVISGIGLCIYALYDARAKEPNTTYNRIVVPIAALILGIATGPILPILSFVEELIREVNRLKAKKSKRDAQLFCYDIGLIQGLMDKK